MNRDWKLAAGTLAIAGALAVPAASTAMVARPTTAIAPLAPCYQATTPNGVNIPVSLSGGGPGDGWVLSATYPNHPGEVGSAGTAQGTYDANGDATATLPDVFVPGTPVIPTAGRPVDLSVSESTPAVPAGVVTQLGTVTLSERGLAVGNGSPNPRKQREVTLADDAFAGKPIYGFITNKARTKVLTRFFLGRADPTCGYLRHPAVVAPPKLISGTYYFFVNPGTKLNKQVAMSQGFTIEIQDA